MQIRRATIDDFPALNELEFEIQALHVDAEPTIFLENGLYSRETYAEFFADPAQAILLVISDENEAVGYLHYEIVDLPQSEYMLARHRIHINALSIKATHRRKGYGEALMEYVINFAKEQGIPDVSLEVWAFNQGAQAFYERLGFRTYSMKMIRQTE